MKKNLFSLLLITLALSCTRQLTEPKIFSLSGAVTVHGQTDFAGITVALYKAAKPDTVLTRLLTAYPSVGLDLSRDVTFDHRLADAEFSTTTNIDGQFFFSDIPDGQYNLVAEKSGYGWSYVLNVDGAAELPAIRLYPENVVTGLIGTYTVWPADQHFIVSGGLTIQDGATLLIDKGCVVRLSNNAEIRAEGAIHINGAADDPVWFTANVPSREIGYTGWRGIAAGDVSINYGRFDFAEICLKVSGGEFSITNSLFNRAGNTAVLIAGESTGAIENNAFLDLPTGVRIEGNSYADVTYNLFANSATPYYGTGLLINASSGAAADNLFRGYNLGCSFEFNTWGNFFYNYLENCTTGVYVNKASSDDAKPVTLQFNTLKNCDNALIDIFNCKSPVVENNNLLQAGAGYCLWGYAVLWKNQKAVSYPNNYWGSAESGEILRRIRVRDPDPNTPYTVTIDPFAAALIPGAGPR